MSKILIVTEDQIGKLISNDTSEGDVYEYGDNKVVKKFRYKKPSYISKNAEAYENRQKSTIISLLKHVSNFKHPNYNTPLEYKDNPTDKTIDVIYDKLDEIPLNNITSNIISDIQYAFEELSGGEKYFNEVVGDIISKPENKPFLKNINGIVDAYKKLWKMFPNKNLDIHDGNIMQTKNNVWKIIDF